MLKIFLITSLGGVCGGIMDFILKDMYKIYITKKRKYVRKFKLKKIFNLGFLIGLFIGGLRSYYGKSVLDIILEKI